MGEAMIKIAAAILGVIVLLAVLSFADIMTEKDQDEREPKDPGEDNN